MATQSKLAELFIDITLRGGGKVELIGLQNQIRAFDKSLANGGDLYKRQTDAKLNQMGQLADRQGKIAQMDAKTYSSAKYLEVARKQASADRLRQQATEIKNYQQLVAQHGRLGAMAISLRQKFAGAGNVSLQSAMGIGIGGMTAGHALSQASPLAADTLSKSFDLLAAQLGTNLVPIVMQVSRGMQILSEWVGEASRMFQGAGGGNNGGPGLLERAQDQLAILIHQAMGSNRDAARVAVQQNNRERPQGAMLASLGPAQFQSFENAWKSIQQSAAGRGPLEERIFEIQTQQLEALLGLRGDLRNAQGNAR